MNKQDYFTLFACCVAVQGASRSTICDLQRNTFELIPNGLYDILQGCKTLSIKEIKEQYGNEYDETIDEYFDFLVEKEFGFWCEKDELVLFPDLDLFWDEPAKITNAIIDIDESSTHHFTKIFDELENLGCKHLQLRVYAPKELSYFENILANLENRRIVSVEIITPYLLSFTKENLHQLINQYARIYQFIAHSAPKNETIQIDSSGMGHILFVEQKVNNHTHCGIISPAYFSINIKTFTEAQKHNSCLNRKISIDVTGEIKNCPSLPQSYGNIATTSLQEALLQKDFKDVWLINKDQIAVCKDCEFRYICTDCRAFITKPEDKFSKPSKCSYNPYTAEWE